MLNLWHAQEGRGWDGVVYLLLALVWLVAQIFSVIAKKAKRDRQGGGAPAKTGVDRPRETDLSRRQDSTTGPGDTAGKKTPPSGLETAQESLRDFLEQLAGTKTEADESRSPKALTADAVKSGPVFPPPSPAFSHQTSLRREKTDSTSIYPVKKPDKGPSGSVRMEDELKFEPSVTSVGAVPAMREIPWVQTGLAQVEGMFPVTDNYGSAARKAVHGRVSRERIRDAFIWKNVLELPRALVPPGNDIIGLNLNK